MAATICCNGVYAHAFQEPAGSMVVGGLPSWGASWGGLPEPEPEQRPVQQDNDGMAEVEMSLEEMEGMMDFLPELEPGDEAGELVQPWVPPSSTASSQEMDSPSVFRCDSPDVLSPQSTEKRTLADTLADTSAPSQPQQQRKRVSFGTVNRVRTIPAVAHGQEIAFAFGVPPPDMDEQLKEHDGPNHSSALMDLLLRAYFERGATTTEYLQHILGAERCLAVSANAPELAELCTLLADQIESGPEGGTVGVLPSNSKLGAAHVPGVRTLAQWMWSC